MAKEKSQSIGFFQKYLTVWVALCMTAGVLIGKLLPAVPAFLGRFEYARVSIPVAILIWVMIYPMMMKVNFQSVKNVGKNPKGLFVTWVTNWLIKPFTMYGIAALNSNTKVSSRPMLVALSNLWTKVFSKYSVPLRLLVKIANKTKGWFPV